MTLNQGVIAAFAALSIGSFATEAVAQSVGPWGPRPVCSYRGSQPHCSYWTWEQCQASARGTGAHCEYNPYFGGRPQMYGHYYGQYY